MRQRRITAADYAIQTEPDAFIDQEDLNRIRRLAGLCEEAGVYDGAGAPVTNSNTGDIVSPVGTTVNNNDQTRRALIDKYQAKTGTDLWFLINFSRPENGALEPKITEYLKQHPEYIQKDWEDGIQT